MTGCEQSGRYAKHEGSAPRPQSRHKETPGQRAARERNLKLAGPRAFSRQLNVRLSPEEWKELERLSRDYGGHTETIRAALRLLTRYEEDFDKALALGIEEGSIRVDEDGRIWPREEAP
jgi:hypothetical protein